MKWYNLLPSSKIVQGFSKSLIYHVHQDGMMILPNELANFFTSNPNFTEEIINATFETSEIEIVTSWLSTLLDNRFIIMSEHAPIPFDHSQNELQSPFRFTNMIVDLEENGTSKFESFIKFIKHEKFNSIQVRFFQAVSNDYIKYIIAELSKCNIRTIELHLNYDEHKSLEFLRTLIDSCNNIFIICLYNAEADSSIEGNIAGFGSIYYFQGNPIKETSCGISSPELFNFSLEHYSESLFGNSCLKNKISVDKLGEIKNCPSMQQSFGNIRDTTFAEAINHPDFKKHWNITKDKIHVCKDCEFRYVCTDCRAYVEDPKDILSKPLKCGYDPYTGEWSEWSTNPLKKKAMQYYGMEDLVRE